MQVTVRWCPVCEKNDIDEELGEWQHFRKAGKDTPRRVKCPGRPVELIYRLGGWFST
jgi:hypothetical protein